MPVLPWIGFALLVFAIWWLGKRNTACGVTFGMAALLVLVLLFFLFAEFRFELTPVISSTSP